VKIEDQLLREAHHAAPREACGLLIGRQSGHLLDVQEAWTMINEEDGLGAFAIDGLALLEAEDRAAASGREVLGLYHSHASGPLWPSPQDRRVARNWPGTLWLIIGATHNQGVAWSAWWSEGGRLDPVFPGGPVVSSAVP